MAPLGRIEVSVLDTEYAQRVLLAALDLLQAVEETPLDYSFEHEEIARAATAMRAIVDERQQEGS